MILKPQKPIREFRFKVITRYHNGEEKEVVLTPEQDYQMNKLLQQMDKLVNTEQPVAQIQIDVGDRAELWIPPGQEPLAGFNTLDDIAGPIEE